MCLLSFNSECAMLILSVLTTTTKNQNNNNKITTTKKPQQTKNQKSVFYHVNNRILIVIIHFPNHNESEPLYAWSDLIFRMLSGNYHPLFMTITLDSFNYPIQSKANNTYKYKKYQTIIGLYLERFAFWHIDISYVKAGSMQIKQKRLLRYFLHRSSMKKRDANGKLMVWLIRTSQSACPSKDQKLFWKEHPGLPRLWITEVSVLVTGLPLITNGHSLWNLRGHFHSDHTSAWPLLRSTSIQLRIQLWMSLWTHVHGPSLVGELSVCTQTCHALE